MLLVTTKWNGKEQQNFKIKGKEEKDSNMVKSAK